MINIIHKLRATNSSNAKLAILRLHADNLEWLAYLKEVYDPFILYGKSGDKNDLRDDLYNLKLCRSIDAGITSVSINKVYSGLIPSASKINKAYDYGKKPKALKFPLFAGKKYDGNYVNVIRDIDIKFFTSGGHAYTHEDHNLNLPKGYAYLAERVHGEGLLGDRRKCALEGPTGSKFAKPSNTYQIFDCINLAHFNNGITTVPYETRLEYIPAEHKAEIKEFHNLEDLEEWLDLLISQGVEGIVMMDPDWLWKDTKSRKAEFCKWKKRHTADFLCIEEIEGEGKSQGIIGSLRLRDSGGREFNVGSGLSLNGDLPFGSYLNKVVEIGYEDVNPDGTYIQPVVISRRHDKAVDDID